MFKGSSTGLDVMLMGVRWLELLLKLAPLCLFIFLMEIDQWVTDIHYDFVFTVLHSTLSLKTLFFIISTVKVSFAQ